MILDKCECYHVRKYIDLPKSVVTNNKFLTTYGNIKYISECWGTKECEECTCGGDTTKCDFYPEKRKENKIMKTFEMMNLAHKTHKIYKSQDMRFDYLKGFCDKNGNLWEGYSFKYLNDLFDAEWTEKPENEMTKSEAEAKYNIKIIGR